MCGIMIAGPNRFQWFENGSAIPGATNPTYSLDNVSLALNGWTFYVVASNETSGATSEAAVLTVVPDVTPPILVLGMATKTNEIALSFSEPLDAMSATNLGNYFISNSLGGQGLVYVARLVDRTNVVLNWFGPNAGDIFVVVNGVRDASQARNMIRRNTVVRVGMDVAMPWDAVWRYNATGADLGTAWRAWGYDDTAWPQGPGLFYNDIADIIALGPGNTRLALTNAAGAFVTTYYFRGEFIAPIGADHVTCTFSHIIDDGVVLYFNGTEIYRWNMPAGTPSSSTLATISVESTLQGPFTVTLTNVLPGKNVFAAEVHQASLTSPDVVFGTEFNFSVPPYILPDAAPASPRIAVSRVNQGPMAIGWGGWGWTLERADVLGPTSGQTQWVPVGEFDSQPNLYLVPTTNGAAFFRLRQ